MIRTVLPLIILGFMACMPSSKEHKSDPDRSQGRPKEPEWARNAVLYECNVRQFSPEGNFQGVVRQLPRLHEMGVDVLWLMPIHPIGQEKRKGSLGSPYSVKDYYAVNPDLGTTDDLKNLIQQAHGIGMKVILDWVPNHTSWDSEWKRKHPEYFTRYNGDFTVPINEKGEPIADWSDICDLDFGNLATRKAMIHAMQYWVKTADIDGFRVDMAGLVPADFWNEARPALDSVKPLFMLSEWQDEASHFKHCFNANYGWKWKDITKDIWQGKQSAQSLDTLLSFLNGYYPEGYYQLYFTQNHDENTWAGTEAELYGPSADAFNVLMFTWQGMPMIYSGQEDNLSQRLAFFEKDPIQWKDYSKAAFFQRLCALRHNNKALGSGINGGPLRKIPCNNDDKIYAFTREKDGNQVMVVLNLSKENVTTTLKPAKSMQQHVYLNVFNASTVEITSEMTLNLKPWEYLVLTNK